MNHDINPGSVMTNTDHFFVKVCGCGVVHICWGPTTLNLTREAFIAVSETLKEISTQLKRQFFPDNSTPNENNVIRLSLVSDGSLDG